MKLEQATIRQLFGDGSGQPRTRNQGCRNRIRRGGTLDHQDSDHIVRRRRLEGAYQRCRLSSGSAELDAELPRPPEQRGGLWSDRRGVGDSAGEDLAGPAVDGDELACLENLPTDV